MRHRCWISRYLPENGLYKFACVPTDSSMYCVMKTKMLSCPASVIMKLKGVYTPHSPHRSHPWIKVAPWRKQHVSSFEKSDLRREKCHPAPLKRKSCVHFYNWPTLLKLHTRDASSDPLKLSFVNLIMIISKSANVHAIDPPPCQTDHFPRASVYRISRL